MEEREIDLRQLIYKVLKKWRNALVLGLIFALILAGMSLFKDLKVALNAQRMEDLQAKYDDSVKDITMQKAVIDRQIDSLVESMTRQQEYNENSMLMKIDPYCEYVGKLIVYVDAGYQIVPDLNCQNPDPTPGILAAYDSYVTCGEMYDYILSRCDFISGGKYLSEILAAEINIDTSTIEVSVLCDSEEHANEILDVIGENLVSRQEAIGRTVAEHEVSVLNRSVLEMVDFTLGDTQKRNLKAITDKDASVSELQLSKTRLATGARPSQQYATGAIVKRAMKKAIIGFVVGIIVCFGWLCMKYIVTRKLSGEDLWKSIGATPIGSIYTGKKSRSALGGRIDKLVRKICGMDEEPDFATSSAIVSANVNALAGCSESGAMALVGSIDDEIAEAILSASKASGRCVSFAGDILCSAEAVRAVEDCSSVILVATEDHTDVDDIKRQVALLKGWGKTVTGAISVKQAF